MRARRLLAAAVAGIAPLLLSFSCASRAGALEPRRPGQEDSIIRAVFADGRLWVLSDAGDLFSIRPGGKHRMPSGLSQSVLDVCSTGGRLKALVCANDMCTRWMLARVEGDHWVDGPLVSSLGERVVGLSCAPSGDVLLTSDRIIELTARGVQSRSLSHPLGGRGVTTVHATAGELYVGENRGEWGGGLRRVERSTGRVRPVDVVEGEKLCAGPLNPSCDPVNAIAAEPWRPDCVLAAVGLVHFTPHGRLVELCAGRVRSVYYRAYGRGQGAKDAPTGGEPFESVAFFGLAESGNEIIAVGLDGLYRFSGKPEPIRVPLPAFQTIEGIDVSFALPGLALVLTTVNERRSVSGAVPLIVARTP